MVLNKTDEIKVDKEKADRILRRIIIMEVENKARRISPLEMAKKIKKIIEEEVQCY